MVTYRKNTAAMPTTSRRRLMPRISHLGIPCWPDRFTTVINVARISSSTIRESIRMSGIEFLIFFSLDFFSLEACQISPCRLKYLTASVLYWLGGGCKQCRIVVETCRLHVIASVLHGDAGFKQRSCALFKAWGEAH